MNNQRTTDAAVDEDAVGGIVSAELNKETEEKDFKCEPCLFDNTEVRATAFCTDCFEHLCKDCARDHRRNKILRNHKLLEGEESTKDLEAIKTLKRMMACSDHPDMDVTYKCEDHDKYICVTCLAECHRKCSNVNEISKAAPSGTEDLCGVLKETLSQLEEYTVSSKSAFEENIESLRSQHSAVQKEQQNAFESIYEQLAQRKHELELETDAVVEKELNELERNLQNYKEAEKEEQEYQRLLDVTLKFGNASEVSVIPDLLSRKAKFLRETLETKYREKRPDLNFDCNVDVKTLANIGQVSVIYSRQVEQPEQPEPDGEYRLSSDEILEQRNVPDDNTKFATENTSLQYDITNQLEEVPHVFGHASLKEEQSIPSTQNTEQKIKPLSLMKRNVSHPDISYNVRCPGDTLLCTIYAIVILPDERLVLIDHDNMNLKVFTETFSLACTLRFLDKPIDLCHVYDMTVAVVYLKGTVVEKYCIGQSHVSYMGKFPTKFVIEALAKFGNDKKIAILFSDEKGTRNEVVFIQIRDAENDRIVETFHLERSSGVALKLEEGMRMLCRGTKQIFISDFWKFHCFDTDERKSNTDRQSGGYHIQELWSYKNRKGSFLKDITDLATDDEGNIYVCGSKSRNIHQISTNNYRQNRIIINNIKEPLSVSVNSTRSYLVVGCGEDDCIHVYHFS